MRTSRRVATRRVVTLLAVGALAPVLLVGLASTQPLSAAAAAPSTAAHHPKPLTMGTFSASAFAASAAALPGGLSTALRRDVGLSAGQYLADSAAAARAVDVVASLKSAGVSVLGSSIHGTSLTVNVASSADAAEVEATGATAVVGAPAQLNLGGQVFKSVSTNIYGGEAYFFEDSSSDGFRCSVGFNGYELSGSSPGQPQFATAGHCATVISGDAYYLPQSKANDESHDPGAPLGTTVSGEAHFGDQLDYGIVQENGAGFVPQPSIATWGDSTKAPLSSAPLGVTGEVAGIVGATLCKSGSTTGWTCGKISAVDRQISVSDGGSTFKVNSIIASTCLLPGDSGGAAVIGQYAAGIDSSSTFGSTCSNPSGTKFAAFFPMISTGSTTSADSVIGQQGANWEPAISVSAPVVAVPAADSAVSSGGTIHGTLANATTKSGLTVSIDGGSATSVPLGASSSPATVSWSKSLGSLAPGTHTYSVTASWGTYSTPKTTTGQFTVLGFTPPANRIGGTDRYAVAVNVAQTEFPDGGPVPVLYVVNGLNFPDGLSAAPAAAAQHGALLLTSPTSLPSEVTSEITSLEPAKIVVVGGTASVSAAVFNKLATMVANPSDITRLGGATRYDTSSETAAQAFSGTISTIFIANGGNFPDALSESAAAAKLGSPVILVPGTSSALDSATMELLESFNPSRIVIAGGTASVSSGIQSQLSHQFTTVLRLGGADRYAVSQLINTTFFSTASTVYIATGATFPDALTGGVVAAYSEAPLVITPSNCVPYYDLQAIGNWDATSATLLGGTGSLSDAVQSMTSCG